MVEILEQWFTVGRPGEPMIQARKSELADWFRKGFTVRQGAEQLSETEKGSLGLGVIEPTTPRVPRYGGQVESYFAGLDITPPTGEEQKTIREQMAEQVQSQIDLIEQTYARLIRGEEVAGRERFGRTRALISGAGILGTPMGAAAKERTAEFTREQIAFREQERETKIAILLEKVDVRATEEIEARRQEALGQAEAYITYLQGKQEEIRETWSGFAKSGQIPLTRMKENEEYYQQALNEMGMDEFAFDLWYESQMPTPQQPDYTEVQYEKDGNIWLKRMAFDPLTGEKTEYNYDLGLPYISGGVEYTTKILDDGTVLLLPKKFDPTKSLEEQIVQYGKRREFAKPIKPEEVEGVEFSPDDRGRLGVAGFSNDDINQLQEGIRTYGWPTVRQAEKDEGMSDEQLDVVEQVLKGVTPTQVGKLAEEAKITWEDQEIRDYLGTQFKAKTPISSIKGTISRDDDMTEADKTRFMEILDETIPADWQAKIDADPDKYEIREDGIYEKVGFWTLRPGQWKRVYEF